MTTTTGPTTPLLHTTEQPAPARHLVGEQLLVVAGQGIAGLGNLAFALTAAHLLAPAQFAALATFLALYLLLFMPFNSLGAGSAAHPHFAVTARRHALLVGSAVGLVLVAASAPIGHLLHLPAGVIALLGVAAPPAGPLALTRGRLYGSGARLGAVGSLVSEPLVRLAAGLALGLVAGAVGAAAGVAAAGWAAWAVAALAARRSEVRASAATAVRARPAMTVAAFLLLAVAQNQDVVLAKRLLPDPQAALFAALSTLGGIAIFATATIPLVLLPRAVGRHRAALPVALGLAGAIGGGTVAAAAVAPHALYAALLGPRYVAVAGTAVPYLLAMALLGLTGVLAAARCAAGHGRSTTALLGAGAVLQTVLVVSTATDARSVAFATLWAVVAMTAGVGTAGALDLPRVRALTVDRLDVRARRAGWAVAGFMLLALGVRLWITRGLWLDEATSWLEATQPYHRMLVILRDTDVHPPLYFTALWASVRVIGDGPLALRMPSIVAGVLLVPAMYAAGRELFDRRTGLVAAAFAVVAPQMVWYSQEARMYAFFMLFAVVAIWLQARAMRTGRWWAWLGFALADCALVWTQYFAALVVAVQHVFVLAEVVRRARAREPVRPIVARWLVSLLVLVAGLAPLVPFTVHQFLVNQASGRGFGAPSAATSVKASLSYYAIVANAIWALAGYHSAATMRLLAALWPLGMLLTLALLGRGRSRNTGLVAAVALVPAAIMFGVGLVKTDLFDLRYFIALVPAGTLLLARAAATWPATALTRGALAVALVAALGAGLVDEQRNQSNPRRYDFNSALHFVDRQAGPGDVVLYEPGILNNLVAYYAPHVAARPVDGTHLAMLHNRRIFVVGSFAFDRVSRAKTYAALHRLERTYRLTRVEPLANVTVWELTR